jgi:ribosomal protein L11 methyltransferase
MVAGPGWGWWRLSLELPEELEESLLWKLPQLGVHRVAICQRSEAPLDRELLAWLPEAEWPPAERHALEEALQPLGVPFARVLPPLCWQRVADEDWSLSWKRHWRPDPVGRSLLVLPAWLEVPPEAEGRTVIRLDPGPAFGTGSHPSTRLCLEAMERLAEARQIAGAPPGAPLRGLCVADLGCGSGLLGLAALALGADAVFAVDTDPLAVAATRENGGLNGFSSLTVGLGSADVLEELLAGRPADLLLCNILAPVIAELSAWFGRLLAPEGLGLLSGLLISQGDGLITTLGEAGWHATLAATQAPWGLLTMERQGPVR